MLSHHCCTWQPERIGLCHNFPPSISCSPCALVFLSFSFLLPLFSIPKPFILFLSFRFHQPSFLHFDSVGRMDFFCSSNSGSSVLHLTASSAVDCVGHWANSSAAGALCSKSCGGGSITQTYEVVTAAVGTGTACAAAAGQTRTFSCNTAACRIFYSVFLFLLLFCGP